MTSAGSLIPIINKESRLFGAVTILATAPLFLVYVTYSHTSA
jgi:hypothetical protein